MKRSSDRRYITNLFLIPSLAITMVFLSCPSLNAQAIISSRSGRLFLTANDLTVQTGPITLLIERSLETRRRESGLLGTRWRLNWESRLLHAGPLVLIEEAGVTVQFGSDGSGAGYKAASGDRVVFGKDGRATRTNPDGTKEIFDAQGRLVERDYRNGNRVVLHYGPKGRLAKIEGPRGSYFRFKTDNKGRVTLIESSTTATVRYAYSDNELSEAQLPPRAPTRYSYFTGGELARIEDPQSGVVQFAYDYKERVVSRSWADGSKERYEYDDAGSRLRYTDVLGAVTTIQWSRDMRREEVTDPLGRKSVLEYDAAGRLLSVTGPSGTTSRTSYDGLGRTLAVENPLGHITRFDYLGESSQVKTITRPDGSRQVFEYDRHGNLTAIRVGSETIAAFTYQPDGSVATAKGHGMRERKFTYYADGHLKSVANAMGEATRYDHDARGNLIREINPLGGVTVGGYDAHDRLLSHTDPTGGTTRYGYDAKGRLSQVSDPAGGVTRFEYDARGRPVAETNPSGQRTRYEYDAAGRLVKAIEPGNRIQTFRYDVIGNMTGQTDRLGRSTQFEYDPLGRLIRERRPTGLEIGYHYDAMGQLVGLEDSAGIKSGLQRDASGLPVATVDPLGAISHYQYDPFGNLMALTDPRGQVKRFTYTPGGMLAGVEEPSGDAARYEYDPAGRLAAIHRPSGGVTKMVYDPMGNPTRLTGPAGNQMGYSYDVAGRLVSATDAAGRVTRYRYDRSGRLTEKQLPDGRRVTYQHDVSGNLLLADDGAFPVRSGYDQAGRLIRREYPAIRKSVAYEYDSQGLRTKLTDSEGRATRYEYNAIKQLAAIALLDGKRITFTYDVKERLTSIQYPNGITGRWDYDAAGRIIKIMYRNQHGKSIAGWTYHYDPAGNLTERKDIEGRTARFQYDLAGQLTEEAAPGGTVRYRYLPGGNRASVEEGGTVLHYHHDTADRLNEADGERLTYDPSGNLIRRERSRAATVYGYDSGGRLVKVMGADGTTTTFGYAPTGERVWKRDRTGMTYYLYDGFDLVQELEETGKVKAAYVHGGGIDRPLAMLRNGRTYYYHADRLGSIMLLTDDRGVVVATYDYDAFGGLRAPPGSVPNPFTFAGREWDASTDLYYYRARYYDPKLGRFLSPDPIPGRLEEPLDNNPYLYVRNNPGRFIDPLGLWTAAQQQVLSDLASAINQGKSIAIGRLPDTLPLAKDPRYWVLNVPREVYTPELNKRVIEIGMEKGARIVPVSPATIENVSATVYGTELQQLQTAGYSNIAPIPSPAAPGGFERVTKILKENKGLIAIKAVRSTYNILTSPDPGEQAKTEAGGWLGMGAGLIIGGPIGAVIGDVVGGGLTDRNMTNALTGNDQDYQNRSAFERNAGEQFIKNLEKIRIIEIQTNIDRIKKSGLPFDTETMLTNIDRTKKSSLPFDTKTDTAGSTPQVGYNPLDDPDLKSGEKKSINVAEIEKLGDEFRQGPGSESKAAKEQSPHQVVQQPPSYTDPGKPPEIAAGTQQVPYPPYPPGYPPDSGQSGARVPWDTLIGQSSGHGGKSRGGTGASGTSTSSPPSPPPPPGSGSGGKVKEPCTEEIACQGWAKGIECARSKREGRGTCIVSQQQVGNCYYRAFEEGLRRGLGLTNSPKPKGC